MVIQSPQLTSQRHAAFKDASQWIMGVPCWSCSVSIAPQINDGYQVPMDTYRLYISYGACKVTLLSGSHWSIKMCRRMEHRLISMLLTDERHVHPSSWGGLSSYISWGGVLITKTKSHLGSLQIDAIINLYCTLMLLGFTGRKWPFENDNMIIYALY
jgi:hypothetical protein